jgi:hypothetical protein
LQTRPAWNVVVRTGIPHGFGFVGEACDGFDTPDTLAQAVHVPGPGKPPLGHGSLAFRGADQQILATPAIAKPASSLTALSLSYDGFGSSASIGEGAFVEIDLDSVTSGVSAGFDALDVTPSFTGHWRTLNLLTATFEATHVDTTTHPFTTTDLGPMTYAAFRAGHAGAVFNQAFVERANCGNASTSQFYVDNFSYGLSGATTTYYFEPDTAVKLSTKVPHTARKASVVAITGFLTRGKRPVANVDVELQAKPKGSKSCLDAGTVASSYNGALYSVQSPTTQTQFRWSFAGSSSVGAIISKPATVKIAKSKKKHRHH